MKGDNTGFFDKTCLGFRSHSVETTERNQLFNLFFLQINSSYLNLFYLLFYLFSSCTDGRLDCAEKGRCSSGSSLLFQRTWNHMQDYTGHFFLYSLLYFVVGKCCFVTVVGCALQTMLFLLFFSLCDRI